MQHEDKDIVESFLMNEIERTHEDLNVLNSEGPRHPPAQTSTNTSSKTTTPLNSNKWMEFRAKCGITTSIDPTMKILRGIKQEMYRYESIECNDHDSIDEHWTKYSNTLPLLGDMVRRYGCLPATSIPFESLFSVAGHLV